MKQNTAITFNVEELTVVVAKNRQIAGELAAGRASKKISNLLKSQTELRMIFAAAPSQNEFLNELTKTPGIEWEKIVAFHMDEYIGLEKNAEQLFGNYLEEHLFSKVNFKKVYKINSDAENIGDECKRYSNLLSEKPADIVCMGIGENGHIAFNDPPVADFHDPDKIKIVKLDEACRQQQVNDGCFDTIDAVPAEALTLTIPSLMSAKHLSIIVPGTRKAVAVTDSLNGPVHESCPASILRTHKDAVMFLDEDSAAKLVY